MVRARGRIGVLLQDKWRLESLLGVGGMAAVYAATHRNGKRVAVKMLHEEFSHDEEVRTRFLQEGYAANIIQHEGAVSVLDDDVTPDGSAFLVMELLEGETVDQRWEKHGRRLPIEEALSIADQLLDVLAAAHAKNIVHRDVKPENLFITKAGVLKVLDFGIAKVFERAEARRTSTQVGMVMGTPAFMAPEQARARWDEVDGRTDLWAVGATLFTTLSGRHVHEATSSQEQLILSATTPAPPLGSVVAGVPHEVAGVIDRALAFDRARRWPNAAAMLSEFRAVLDALGGRLGPVSIERSIIAQGHQALAELPLAGAATLASPPGALPSCRSWMKERDARQAELAEASDSWWPGSKKDTPRRKLARPRPNPDWIWPDRRSASRSSSGSVVESGRGPSPSTRRAGTVRRHPPWRSPIARCPTRSRLGRGLPGRASA